VSTSATSPRIAIAGAGALGSAFGAMLRLSGCPVALLTRRRDHRDAVRSGGLTLTGLWGERVAHDFTVCDEAARLPEVEYVLVTTKSYDTHAIVTDVARRQPNAQFVTLQNGLGNIEALCEIVGAGRTIGGMVIVGFSLKEPGVVDVTVYGGDVLLGRPDAREGGEPDELVSRLAAAFSRAGITTRCTDNIRGAIWGKVLYNCSLNALGAVLGVPYGELTSPHTWSIIRDVVEEAFAVATAHGAKLAWPDAASYLEVLATRQIPATAAHRASMLQDIERSRRTEIEHLNGAVERLAAKAGITAPVNAALAGLVRHMEAHAHR
jgi:2-dehydropantoate 2-reductase